MTGGIPDHLHAFVAANFSALCARFEAAGLRPRSPAPGILHLPCPAPRKTMQLLLSVGVHGDETAPIEIVAQLLDELAAAPDKLGVDLMIAVCNPDAIAQGRRFIDVDLNRLFRRERGELQSAAEALRADTLMNAVTEFFAQPLAEKWHLDLHTAIRPSHYERFAVVPDTVGRPALLAWLADAGIEAVILSPSSAGTFSAYAASACGATSATVELGQVSALGANDLDRFAAARTALAALIREGRAPAGSKQPAVFRVVRELTKKSAAFRMALGADTWNFTAMPPGEVIATDGDTVYRVGARTEYIVFPNPDVRVGFRAGVMVACETP